MLHVIEKPSPVILPTAQTNIHPLTTTSTNSSQQCRYSQPRLFVLRSSILLEHFCSTSAFDSRYPSCTVTLTASNSQEKS